MAENIRNTKAAHTSVSVGVTSTQLLAANPTRVYALIVNRSDTLIMLSVDGTAATDTDIPLYPNGGAYEFGSEWNNLYTGVVYAISTGVGGKMVNITEGS